jgi:methylated-DNA-[protein]-cysteine S-methyltransferase
MNAVSPELDRRFRDAAADDGLLDAAYDFVDSPIGPLLVATSKRGLCRISYDAEPEQMLEELARTFGVRVLRSAKPIDPTRRELDEYFEGKRTDFDLPIDWSLVRGDFGRRVLQATARIPFGEVSTYRDVATRAGSAGAVRAAGNALGTNPMPIVVPCHRVLRTGGGLGGYTGGLHRKETLLGIEGVLPAKLG